MRLVILFLAIAIAAAAYFLLVPQEAINIQNSADISARSNASNQTALNEAPSNKAVNALSSSGETNVLLPSISVEEKLAAQAHVKSITARADTPIDVVKADHFVSAEQLLQLPELTQASSVLISAPSVSVATVDSTAPVTAVSTVKTVKFDKVIPAAVSIPNGPVIVEDTSTPAQTFAVKIPSFKQTELAPVIQKSSVTSKTANQSTPSTPNKILTSVSPQVTPPVMAQAEKTTLLSTLKQNIAQISDVDVAQLSNLVASEPAKNQTQSITIESATPDKPQRRIAFAIRPSNDSSNADSTSNENKIQLRELLDETNSDKKRIFYLHAVNPTDEQGIWGIIQQGLTGTFSKGIKITKQNGELKTLIPDDADEMLSNSESSFLGRLLNNKVLTTYVYNYEQGNIGKNPDVIQPGQQLIIVTFTEDELISIYQHFSKQLNQ